MQIDFHHAVTYVVARAAGFPHEEAGIIAYAAQYVDDATVSGIVEFDNGALYVRIASAHKAVDLHNLDRAENLQVWVPFHFLPANGGKAAGEDPEGTFIRKIICGPNSPIAQEMVTAAILDQDKPYALHRLGVAMHVYADTWAHQGFAGVEHDVNEVDDATEISGSHVFDGLSSLLGHFIEYAAPRLGHARASILPDLPFLFWRYKNGHGEEVVRDNISLFCDAADNMCKVMQRFRRRDPAADVPGLGDHDKRVIRELLGTLRDLDAVRRHQEWLRQIENARFSFPSAIVAYANGLWKTQALGTAAVQAAAAGAGGSRTVESGRTCHYTPGFLQSNWKLFHDAMQAHRLTVLHDILPRYGICSG